MRLALLLVILASLFFCAPAAAAPGAEVPSLEQASAAATLSPRALKRGWVRRYNGPGNGYDEAKAVAVDAQGNVYVTGHSFGSGTGYDYATIKYDADGNRLWVRRYNGPANGADYAVALALDSQGNVYVTGYSDDVVYPYDYTTIKYDPDGKRLWVQRYNGPGNGFDYVTALVVDGDGNVYVTGYSHNGATSDYATVKYDTNGKLQWVRRFDGGYDDLAQALAVDAQGNVYVTGYTLKNASGSDWDYATIKYDAAGKRQWLRRYNGPASPDASWDYATAVAVDGEGNVFVTGSSRGIGTGGDYATIKYDAAGSRQWVRRYNGPQNIDDIPAALVVDGQGRVYVTGKSNGVFANNDYTTIKYDTHGNRVWLRRYNGPYNGDDQPAALAVDDKGQVFITGFCQSSWSNYDYATVIYDTEGYRQVLRYNGPAKGDDRAAALALDGEGNVYVTGYSQGDTSLTDFATIKYVPLQPPALAVR